MLSTVLELAGFLALVAGAFLVLGVGGALVAAGLVVMVVGYMVGEPE
jgi:hypothetical protein